MCVQIPALSICSGQVLEHDPQPPAQLFIVGFFLQYSLATGKSSELNIKFRQVPQVLIIIFHTGGLKALTGMAYGREH